jgi:hypothetical protein
MLFISPVDSHFKSIVIVPMMDSELHESGYRCMKYVFVDGNDEIIGVSSGKSDVIFLNGIGGYGLTDSYPRVGWQMDCLPSSGCVRLYSDKDLCLDKCQGIGESFCVYSA